MRFIVDVIKRSALPMEPPKAYGAFHLLFFIGGIFVIVALSYWLRNSSDKQNKRILLTAGFFLLVFEIYKQIFQFVAIGYTRYPFGIFPFHLCSTPMYLCLLAGFVKPGRLQDALMTYIATFGFIGGFTSFFEPSGLNHGYWVQTLHSYSWHMILVFLGVYLSLSGRAGRHKQAFKDACRVFGILCSTAFLLNLAFLKVSAGTMNMFFVGPAHSSLIVFSEISKRFGWYVNTPIFIGCLICGAYLIYRAGLALRSACSKQTAAALL